MSDTFHVMEQCEDGSWETVSVHTCITGAGVAAVEHCRETRLRVVISGKAESVLLRAGVAPEEMSAPTGALRLFAEVDGTAKVEILDA